MESTEFKPGWFIIGMCIFAILAVCGGALIECSWFWTLVLVFAFFGDLYLIYWAAGVKIP